MASEQELADMERLSAGYVPEQAGPLVGPLLSSTALTLEYAKADPVYASKTARLPETHPLYRTIKGDGNCGFRAIGFGYFEALIRHGSPASIRKEAERLESLNKLLDATGQDVEMYEDWVQVTLELLEQTASIPSRKDNEAALLEAFNVVETANAITQHFRMITSAWMKMHIDDYAPFVDDHDVHNYCGHHIDPFFEEIEHVGVKALTDAVITPAGIAVDCLYLDRSPGNEATNYSFHVQDSEGNVLQSAPTIRLLYRPGHYDLLYKEIDTLEKGTAATPTASEAAPSMKSDLHVRTFFSPPDPDLSDSYGLYDSTGFDPSSLLQQQDMASGSSYDGVLDNFYPYQWDMSQNFYPEENFALPLDYSGQSHGESTTDTKTHDQAFALQTNLPVASSNGVMQTRPSENPPKHLKQDKLDWSPIVPRQKDYDRIHADGVAPSPDPPENVSKKHSMANLPFHIGQDPEKFEPKMYDVSKDKRKKKKSCSSSSGRE